MTLLAEAKVQGSHVEWPGLVPETDGRLKQNLAYHLPAPFDPSMPPLWAASSLHAKTAGDAQ